MEKMMQKFEQVFVDDTKNGKKIPTSKYLVNGKYPIIDQGQNQIGGYTDMGEGIYDNVPAIVFGDHTRVVKYIDKPFYIGADGVKILKAIDSHNCVKYLYYYLSSKKIENTGYNRHFKWLKEKTFEIPSLPEQESTAGKIDVVCGAMEKQKKKLELCDTLIKSKFNEMFGDPVMNNKGWGIKSLNDISKVIIAGGDTPEDRSVEKKDEYKYPIFSNGEKDLGFLGYSKKYRIDEPALTISARGGIGFTVVREPNFTPVVRLITIVPNESINLIFLKNYIDKIKILKTGSSQGQLTIPMCKNIKVFIPPLPLQQQFADFVNEVEESKLKIKESLNKTETLYKALMQKYFEKGE